VVNDVNTADLKRDPLAEECVYLSKNIFGILPDDGVIHAYKEAHKVVFFSGADELFYQALSQAIKRGCDLEAVECAWRLKDKSNVLTKKFNILFYLTEARSESFPIFVNQQASSFKAYFSLAFHLVRSLYKLVKGYFILKTSLFDSHRLTRRSL